MAKKQYFENLLGAMQESILKAHSMIVILTSRRNR